MQDLFQASTFPLWTVVFGQSRHGKAAIEAPAVEHPGPAAVGRVDGGAGQYQRGHPIRAQRGGSGGDLGSAGVTNQDDRWQVRGGQPVGHGFGVTGHVHRGRIARVAQDAAAHSTLWRIDEPDDVLVRQFRRWPFGFRSHDVDRVPAVTAGQPFAEARRKHEP